MKKKKKGEKIPHEEPEDVKIIEKTHYTEEPEVEKTHYTEPEAAEKVEPEEKKE